MRIMSTGRGRMLSRSRRQISRRSVAQALVEALEPRTLLSGFSAADATGTWNLLGTGQLGTIEFGGNGIVNGGSLLEGDGSTNIPSDTYTINAKGVFSLGDSPATGAMNSAKDLLALSNPASAGLSVLTNPAAASFSLSDLSGTWNFAINGADFTNSIAADSGFGTITFNGAGSITAGAITTGSGTSTITGGTYSVTDGQYDLQFNIDNGGQIEPVEQIGSLNASKDVLALDPPSADFPDAVAGGQSTLVTAIRQGSGLSDSAAAGTWLLFGVGDSGYITLDSTGHVTAGQIDTHSGNNALSGTYSVAANGTLNLNLTATGPGGKETFIAQGGINSSGSVLATNSTQSENDMIVGIKVSSTPDHPPTLTSVTPFSGAVDGTPYDISAAQLLNASNAADKDGDALQLQVTSLGPGFLEPRRQSDQSERRRHVFHPHHPLLRRYARMDAGSGDSGRRAGARGGSLRRHSYLRVSRAGVGPDHALGSQHL